MDKINNIRDVMREVEKSSAAYPTQRNNAEMRKARVMEFLDADIGRLADAVNEWIDTHNVDVIQVSTCCRDSYIFLIALYRERG